MSVNPEQIQKKTSFGTPDKKMPGSESKKGSLSNRALSRRMSKKNIEFNTQAKVVKVLAENADNDSSFAQKVEVVRVSTKKILATTLFGYVYTNILLVLSVLSAFQYIYQTYLDGSNEFERV